MFNKQIMISADMIARSNETLGRSLSDSNRELGNRFESITKELIKSKDRVDISLEEYERMKQQISSLDWEVRRLRSILEKIEAPLDKNIIPNSIRTCYCQHPMEFKRTFRVEFDINERDW